MKQANLKTYVTLFSIGIISTAYAAADTALRVDGAATVPVGWLFAWLLGGGAVLIFVGRKLSQLDAMADKINGMSAKVDALSTLLATRPCVLTGYCNTNLSTHKKPTNT